jgi:hypothetical protein
MKIQCSCGAKYDFDVTPEMVRNPIRFVCPSCGLDSSDFVNELIRNEIAEQFPAAAASSRLATPAASQLKIAPAEAPAEPPPEAPSSGYCAKHRNIPATGKCIVCGNPICPRCMELFGYFCSPLCKNKADLQGIAAPVYSGQKFRAEARFFQKIGFIFGLMGAALAVAVVLWIWYAWFGSVPHTYFSVRFEDTDRAYAGAARLVGEDQIVFLHGGTLARYDLKTKKPVWSLELITREQIDDVVKSENDSRARLNQSDELARPPSPEALERRAKIALQRELSLQVSGQNIWVAGPDGLTHYDWADGKVLQEIPLPQLHGEVSRHGDELLVPGTGPDTEFVTHVNLASGEEHTEEFHEPGTATVAAAGVANGKPAGTIPGAASQSTDAQKLAEEAQNVNLPGRIALPALLGNEIHQRQIMAELQDNNQGRPAPGNLPKPGGTASQFTLIPDQNGFMQMRIRLLEKHIVTRDAMKAAPGKSSLDGNLTVAKTADVANEMLNEMQRNSGGGTVSEDQSRYQVTLHRPEATEASDWIGEVIGPPQLFPLETVNVLTAGKTVIVFDKSNKKLWEANLTYPVPPANPEFGEDALSFGAGPCVEHGGLLYIFDQAVLSAFDLATGNARWRWPSVGVVGLFFDSQGMLYVNTTTGNPDDIRYARQIDVTKSTAAVLLKIEPQTGKTLWSVRPGGFACYLSGKYLYAVRSYDPNSTDAEVMNGLEGLQKPPYFQIARINLKNGRTLWEYDQGRVPVAIHFKDNFIELVFKREVQVLTYLSF